MTPLYKNTNPTLRRLTQYNKYILLYYNFYIHKLSKKIYNIYTILTIYKNTNASLRRLTKHI